MIAPPSIEHVAITVSDLERSVAWYEALFGVAPMFVGPMLADTEHAHDVAVWAVPNLGLHCFRGVGVPPGGFDARRAGLDHLAFRVSDAAELEQWLEHLHDLGVDHAAPLEEAYGVGVAIRDPDGVALELFLPKTFG